jgi:hypothetical protein
LWKLIVREWQSVSSLRQAAGAALLLALSMLTACGDLALPNEEMPASGPDPSYHTLIAKYFSRAFKDYDSYNAFEISAFRWVHSLNGWAWIACVRFQDRGHPRIYALFIKDGKVVDGRYAVQSDACDAQTYTPFVAMRPARPGILEPLY